MVDRNKAIDDLRPTMQPTSLILCADYAGLHSQGLGLAEAAGLAPDVLMLAQPGPLRRAAMWVRGPLADLPAAATAEPRPDLVISLGSYGAAIGAALRRRGQRVVHVQHPRRNPDRYDLVVVNRHDGFAGPNVIVTRTALHRVTAARLEAERAIWRDAFAHLPRPLVAALIGGSNGRHSLDEKVAARLAASLGGMMAADRVGLMVTPSRRTGAAVTRVFADALRPRGAFVWDGAGPNPYFGMLALADAIVVTQDSISMISEAAATTAPVLLAGLPGHSRRQSGFTDGLIADGRIRPFAGRLETWAAEPMNDTIEAGAEMRRRLGY